MSNSRLQTAEVPRVKQKLTASEIFVEYGAAIALAALILFNIIFTKNFLSVNTLFTIIKQSTPILFTTIGMTIVISAGGTDISAGSMMGFCGIICALSLSAGMNFYLSVLLSLALCALIGIFNGLLIAKAGVQPIILTLVMQIVMRGVTVMLADSKVFPLNSYPEVKTLGLGRLAGGVPIQAIFFCIAAILGLFLINRTTLGKYVEAIGGSERAARLAGIRTVLIIVTVYTLSAVFAGMAGILEMARNGALDPSELGKLYELDAIAGVAIGGTSMKGGKARVLGSIMGCVLMIMVGTTVNMNGIPFAVSNIIKAAIIIFSLAIQREKTA